MAAHHGAEHAVLHPTDIQFLIERVPGGAAVLGTLIVAVGEESSQITVEVGVTREGEVQTGRNLVAEAVPVGLDIAGPCVGTVALLSGKH